MDKWNSAARTLVEDEKQAVADALTGGKLAARRADPAAAAGAGAEAVQLSSDLDLGLDPVDGDAAARALPAGRVAQAAGAKRAHEERDQRFLDEMQRAADRLELDERKKPPPES